eukprot:Clim_evm45s25 gene=Clim_evmTU45s25
MQTNVTTHRRRFGRELPAETDLSKWQLHVDDGQQWWEYDAPQKPSRQRDELTRWHMGFHRDEDFASFSESVVKGDPYLSRALHMIKAQQSSCGHWAGDYGGPLFTLHGEIIAVYAAGLCFSDAQVKEIRRYMLNTFQYAEEPAADGHTKYGGWGLFVGQHPTMFGTGLTYVCLRILGVDREREEMRMARQWILEHGGLRLIPNWGKFWLAVMNLYSWDGFNGVLQELWLLPKQFPLHPSRMWCHSRMVYLPMGYVAGKRFSVEESALVRELREDLFVEGFENVDWSSAKWDSCEVDVYRPVHPIFKAATMVINAYDYLFSGAPMRQWALEEIYEQVSHEDRTSDCVDIGPVSKAMNMLCHLARNGKECPMVKRHFERMYDYLWMSPEGLKSMGTNGSQLWDASFMARALLEVLDYEKPEQVSKQLRETLDAGLGFVLSCQKPQPIPDFERHYRVSSYGSFPFSNRQCGWIVTDCSAEAIMALMTGEERRERYGLTFPPNQLLDEGICRILEMQNDDGGWATYEEKRGGDWWEILNPAEVFGDIMVDYSHVELSSTCLRCLQQYRSEGHLRTNSGSASEKISATTVDRAIERGLEFMRRRQRPDGSWEGFWAVNFTYGTLFGVQALVHGNGERFDRGTASDGLELACEFLIEHQMTDGCWSEDVTSCATREWQDGDEDGSPVQTAWAVMALVEARHPNTTAINRAIQWLMDKQQPVTGEWIQREIVGIFNRTCAIHYSNYPMIWCTWAIAMYRNAYPGEYRRLLSTMAPPA